jgi:hypothetical protein
MNVLWTDEACRDDRLMARLGLEACAYRELLERALAAYQEAICAAKTDHARYERLLADFRRLQHGADDAAV